MIRFALSVAIAAVVCISVSDNAPAQGPFRRQLNSGSSNNSGMMSRMVSNRQQRLGGSFMEPERRKRRQKVMGTVLLAAASGLSGYASSGAIGYTSPTIGGSTVGGSSGFNANRASWSAQRSAFNSGYSWNPDHLSVNGLR